MVTESPNEENTSHLPDNNNLTVSKLRCPPAIFVHGVVQFAGLVRTLGKILATGKFVTLTLPNDVVKVITYDAVDYRLLVRELRKLDVKFYTFQLKAECVLKVFLCNIHQTVSPEDIKQVPGEIGYNCHNVANRRH